MKHKYKLLMAGSILAITAIGNVQGATLILGDDYNVLTSGTGFGVSSGVNAGISTRLLGTAAADIRYSRNETARGGANHYITNTVAGTASTGKMWINYGGSQTSISFTNNAGGGWKDFGPALFSTAATPDVPSVYEIQVEMANYGTNRWGFGISTAIGQPQAWDFGFQMYRATPTDPMSLLKRIDLVSGGVGLDVDAVITNDVGVAGTDVTFLMRVTDAGAESSTFSSRVELAVVQPGVSTNWIYDTQADTTDLPFGWRFRGVARYLLLHATGDSGPMSADNLRMTWISGPTRGPIVQTWTGGGSDDNWSTAANWGGTALASGDLLVFGAPVRQNNINDLSSFLTPGVTFTAGGFDLGGNQLKVFRAITNSGGNNTITLPLTWTSTGAKTWSLAAGTKLTLAGTTAVDVGGDHTLLGGGTLTVSNAFQIGSASTATPVILVADARMILDGAAGQFTSRAGFRIGASGAGGTPTVAELLVTNGATFYQTLSGASCRVGSTANGITNRLIIQNSTFTQSGGEIGIPWVANATGEVTQVNSTVSDSYITFNHDGAGAGVYSVKNGTIEARAIKKNFPGGLTAIHFDNATLRTSPFGGESAFMAALDVAEIKSGGLTLDITSTDTTLASPFSGTGVLTKSGSYTATLTGQNTYTGNTVVQAGKLVLPTTQTNAAAIQVADGAQFGVVVTAQGSTLTAGSLSLAGASSTLNFDLGTFANPTVPVAQVSTLSLAGTVTVNVTGGSLAMVPGVITLLKWSSPSVTPAFVQGSLPPNFTGTIVADSDSIDLVVTGVQGYRWTGATDGVWDMATQNWLDLFNSTPALYQDGYATEFRDGASTGNVSLSGTMSPALLTVNNASLAYSFQNGTIVTPLLRKEGSGSVTRTDGSSDQIGQIELNGGWFVANATVDADFSLPLADTSAGLGTFVKEGAGILSMVTNNSTFDGTVLIQGGTLRLTTNAVSALGSTNGITVITNGASLDVYNRQSPHEPVVVSGEGVGGQGAVVNNAAGGAVQNNLTDVTLAGDTTFGCIAGSRWDIRVRTATGPGPGLRGNGFNVTKVGGGSLSISSQRHDYGAGVEVPYWHMNLGDIFVKEGSIAFEEAISLDNPGKLLVLYPSTTMNLFSMGVTNPLVRNITITNASLTCGGVGATNIINGNLLMDGAIGIRVNGAYYVFNGNMSGNASLEIGMFSGNPGYIFLNGASTITGDTTVTNSTLLGSGSVAGNLVVTQSGKLAPGVGVGTFSVGGNATLAATTVTTMELAPGQSPNADQLAVTGTIAAGGNLVITNLTGAMPVAGEVFQLFNKGVSGFASIVLPDISASGLEWNTDNLAVNGSIVAGAAQPPNIDEVSLVGGIFTFSGTGGTAGGTYYIVTSPDVSVPMSSWVPVETNTFGPGGTFTFSTNITGGGPEAFFRLKTP